MIIITVFKRIFYIFFTSFLIIAFTSCSSNEPIKQVEQTEQTVQIEQISHSVNNQNVTDEVYNKTFFDIQEFIEKLNTIIGNLNFTEWRTHLTQDYIIFYSNSENLRQISESSTTLKRHRIVLRTLRDYFEYVVAPSRSEVRLDSIAFVDDNNVMAYMIIDGEPFVIYNLVKINNNWKVEK